MPHANITVIVAKWTSDPYHSVQVTGTIEKINSIAGPVILMGDLAFPPDSWAIQVLLNKTGLQNAFADTENVTVSREGHDYILFKGLTLSDFFALETSLESSSHVALVASFLLESTPIHPVNNSTGHM